MSFKLILARVIVSIRMDRKKIVLVLLHNDNFESNDVNCKLSKNLSNNNKVIPHP